MIEQLTLAYGFYEFYSIQPYIYICNTFRVYFCVWFKECSDFILLHEAVKFSQHHLLKRLFTALYSLAFSVID